MLYNVTNTERITKVYAPKVGMLKIRIYDLRHSHASVLKNLGINPLSIAKRLGR